MDNKKNNQIIGKHHMCEGNVKHKYTNLTSFRYCEKCGASTDDGDVVFTKYEASLWK